ncbi:MAG: YHYH protein [Planctomycetes bacterium]|nr:YHYH protein [Planctomycetota bacterium]
MRLHIVLLTGILALAALLAVPLSAAERENLIENGGFEEAGAKEAETKGFVLEGDAARAFVGLKGRENSSMGVVFASGEDKDGDGKRAGAVTAEVQGLKADEGRWFRFRFRGLPENGFAVGGEHDLYMKAEFFATGGKDALDGVVKYLWPIVQQRRKDLDANGLAKRKGAVVWQDYELEFKLPFPNVDTLRLSIGYRNGSAASAKEAAFWLDDVSLERIDAPKELDQALANAGAAKEVKLQEGSTLVQLGGRWYFERLKSETETPKTFTAAQAARLYYKAARLEAPFAGNMSAWLRAGFLDLRGREVKQDTYVPDSVTVSFTEKFLVVKAKNLPNHPTAIFPGYLGNPNSIQEQDRTYKLPLDPQPDPNAKAMDAKNKNRALNMGPVGLAANGVVFYNPFDAGMEEAVDIMDRCCGHPSPDGMYHYHKYPVCVRSPWADEGQEHSPLLGFAFDGFPIYGPYEKKDTLAKDDKDNPLNAFNVHKDDARGWHYHVTPGKFPYIIGGYYGAVEASNVDRGPPGGRGGPGEGRGPPGGEGGPPAGDRPPAPRGPGRRPPPPPQDP